MKRVTLTPHPETRSKAVRSVAARAGRLPGAMLAVSYVLEGDLDRLRLPVPARLADGLWQHTCCEVFIARAGLPGYHEFNFAPSGEWAAYAFARYREAAPLAARELDPQVLVRSTASTLELDALIPLDRLSPLHPTAQLSLALSVVVEEREGVLSYWALKHAAGKPDFHHPEAFVLVLDEIRN